MVISHPSSFAISCFLSQCIPLSTHPYIHIIVVCEFERMPTKLKGNPGSQWGSLPVLGGSDFVPEFCVFDATIIFSLLPLFSVAAFVAITTCCTGVQDGEFALYSFCCCCCHQMLKTKELKEERVHFSSQFPETVHHESQWEELEATAHIPNQGIERQVPASPWVLSPYNAGS